MRNSIKEKFNRMFPKPWEIDEELWNRIQSYLREQITKDDVVEGDFDKLVLASYGLIFLLGKKDISKSMSIYLRELVEKCKRMLNALDELKKDWYVLLYLDIKPNNLARTAVFIEGMFEEVKLQGRPSHLKPVFIYFVSIFHLLQRVGYSKPKGRRIVYNMLSNFQVEDYDTEYEVGKLAQLDRLRHIQKRALETPPFAAELLFMPLLYHFQEDISLEKKFHREYHKAYKKLKEEMRRDLNEQRMIDLQNGK